MQPDQKWTGPINPGNPVPCETCGKRYVPQDYEGRAHKCPHCGT